MFSAQVPAFGKCPDVNVAVADSFDLEKVNLMFFLVISGDSLCSDFENSINDYSTCELEGVKRNDLLNSIFSECF